MTITLSHITIKLIAEAGDVQVIYLDKQLLLRNQTLQNVADLLKHNFSIVQNHYLAKVAENPILRINDIDTISVLVISRYLYMYNMWKNEYKNKQNMDLTFRAADFSNSTTHDIIIFFFKQRYSDWKFRCCALLDMEPEQFEKLCERREAFYNK